MNHHEIENEEALWSVLARKIAEVSRPHGVLLAGRQNAQLLQALKNLDVMVCAESGSERTAGRAKENPAGSLQRPRGESTAEEGPERYLLMAYAQVQELVQGGKDGEEIRRMCAEADRVLLYRIPDALDGASRGDACEWARLVACFARCGLYDDLLSWPSSQKGRTVCFVRKENACRQLMDYDRCMRQKEQALEQAMAEKLLAEEQLRECRKALLNEKQRRRTERQQQQKRLDEYAQAIGSYQSSGIWRVTAPYRHVMDRFKATKAGQCLVYAKQKGIRAGLKRAGKLIAARINRNQPVFRISRAERKRQEEAGLSVRISILVPLCNASEASLREMIHSVEMQTYSNWELCLADASDAGYREAETIAGAWQKDQRIIYKRLERSGSMPGNMSACMDMATGEYLALLEQGDLLHPSALFEVVRAIREKGADLVYTDENTFRSRPEDACSPRYKPDYAPDTLRSCNYIGHLMTFRATLLEEAGGFQSGPDGAQDYDLALRLTEKAKRIVHIPKMLYYHRGHADSSAAMPCAPDADRRALAGHLARIGLDAEVTDGGIPSTYRIRYRIGKKGMVSILIPNKDHADDLEICIDSIREKTTYPSWEIVIVENNSTERRTFEYYRELEKDSRIHIVEWKEAFNYSAINNFGAQYAHGEYILLLNNDVEIITPDWLEQMVMFAQREDVGAVGSMLYYPDDTVQHAGVILGICGAAGHAHKYLRRGDGGYMNRMAIAQNYSAVTAACMMMRRRVWEELGGLDESYTVALNDVDLCMRIREAGYLIVWTPYAELYHYESRSRGFEDTPEKQSRLAGEVQRFTRRWKQQLEDGDPYYNPNLTLEREDFSVKEAFE